MSLTPITVLYNLRVYLLANQISAYEISKYTKGIRTRDNICEIMVLMRLSGSKNRTSTSYDDLQIFLTAPFGPVKVG